MDDQITLAQFISDNGITMKVEWADRNPNMDSTIERSMDHWRCVMKRPGKTMTTYFSMGMAHNGREPRLDEVLDCLSSDNHHVSDDFEDWCAELGYDPDSRKAEKIYKTCERQAAKLKTFLGADAFEVLLYGTERL